MSTFTSQYGHINFLFSILFLVGKDIYLGSQHVPSSPKSDALSNGAKIFFLIPTAKLMLHR